LRIRKYNYLQHLPAIVLPTIIKKIPTRRIEKKIPPTLVIPVGKLNPEGIEVKEVQPYQQV
jgi:hypothetical protein